MSLLKRFLRLESASGIVLFLSAFIAFIWANTFTSSYHHFWQQLIYQRPLLFWLNEGLMTGFFFLVALELKRECMQGELKSLSACLLPVVAALGGMIVPALCYFALNGFKPIISQGWSIPVATDIAFSLSVLSLFGKRIPQGLKLFLLALAIVDDLGAILLIACVHTKHLAWPYVFFTLAIAGGLTIINQLKIVSYSLYGMFGFMLWYCILKAGVHATLAGVLLALLIPLRSRAKAPLQQLESALHPWIAFCVLPLFALANAGFTLPNAAHHLIYDSETLGIILGLCLGKPLGIMLFSACLIGLGLAKLPSGTGWLSFLAVAVLCGIGFTMSLFLGTLAFQNQPALYLLKVKVGVLLASLISGVLGAIILQCAFTKRQRSLSHAKR